MAKKLLIVTDGKAGHENQSKAFCSALGYEYDCVRAGYPTRIHKALSYLVDRMGLILDFPFTIEKTDGYYAAVVCTGSTAFYPGKIAARRRGMGRPPACARKSERRLHERQLQRQDQADMTKFGNHVAPHIKRARRKTPPRPDTAVAAYFLASAAMASLSTLMPACASSIDRVSDSRAAPGLWKPSEFSAVHHSQ